VEPFRQVSGIIAPLDRASVDTDQIIPKQFLKRIERSGYGPFLFVLDRPEYRGATVLVTGANFGCGSSREHATWALLDAGFRVVVAPSFADIFLSNCLRVGLLPVVLPEADVRLLVELAQERPGARITVDLHTQSLEAPGIHLTFAIDPFWRDCLLNGWDEIALTMKHEALITRYEAHRRDWLPVT
jgi:3-isopropylmalate/(R)-2-methylmalate dehydratase small subunit